MVLGRLQVLNARLRGLLCSLQTNGRISHKARGFRMESVAFSACAGLARQGGSQKKNRETFALLLHLGKKVELG